MDAFFRQLGFALNYTQELLIIALILARTVAMIQLTPFLGGKIVPMQIKMGLAVVLTIIMWPLARSVVDIRGIPTTAVGFTLLMLKEVFIGFVIGFINGHIFFVMNMAGRLIDTARGTSMSEVQDPHSKKRATPVGDLYTQLFLIIFVVINGHHIFFEAFFYSFQAMPVHLSPDFANPRMANWLDQMLVISGEIWQIAVVLASPVMAATFITDVVFGILNRVAPQLNAYFMSMPVKAFFGVLMIFVAIGAIITRMEDWVEWTLVTLNEILELFFILPPG